MTSKCGGGSDCSTVNGAGSQCALGNELSGVLKHFEGMVDHCFDFAEKAKAAGRPIVGMMCEFTPRELILAAGAVPVCLCGGSAATIPVAEQVLPSNLCPLIKSTFGYLLRGDNPFLSWADLVVAETTCDGKKKMFELMGQSKSMYVLELPQKSEDPDGLDRWVREVRKFKEFLEKRFDVQITDEVLQEAISVMNFERGMRRQLADQMALEEPPLTGRQLLDLKSTISAVDSDLGQYEKALKLFRTGAAAEGSPKAANDKSRIRVMLTGVPMVHGAERVLELIEGCGAVVVCMENCTGLKPILEDVELKNSDPIRAIAKKYYHLPCSVMTPNQSRLETLRTLANKFRPQCLVDLVWQGCLTYDVESVRVRRFAEEELHLPYLKITTDYSPSDSARITARFEALVEMIRNK